MSLRGSKTEENLKAAFSGESQANRRYLYFAQSGHLKDITMLLLFSVQQLKEKRATPMVIWSWKLWATLQQVYPSVTQP